MTGAIIPLTSDDVAHQLAELSPEDAYFAPMLEAVRDHGLSYAQVMPGELDPVPALCTARPQLIFVRDDMRPSIGPEAFPSDSLHQALQGAGAVLLQTRRLELSEIFVYRDLVDYALQGRSVVVATWLSHETKWRRFLSQHVREGTTVGTASADPWRYSLDAGRA
jgi:hypothetical protein